MGWSEAASPSRRKLCRQPRRSPVCVLGMLWHGPAALPKTSGQVRWDLLGPRVSVCLRAQSPSSSIPLQSSHLTSQHTKVWPFPALQQEFLQRHINNSQSCFTLSSALGQKLPVKCGSIGQIFCVKKAKGLWTWQGFYLYFILFIESLVLDTGL